jgi:3-deoxy-D-manno-octulosonic-acid transferase
MTSLHDAAAVVRPPRRPGLGGLLALIAYQLVYLFAFLLWGPVLLWRLVFDPRYRGGVYERMGFAPPTVAARPVVWIHAVSVGELKATRQLLAALFAEYPDHAVVISSTTPTGRALARQLYPQLATFYYPLDFGPFPWLALRRVRPAVVLLVELEYWPNFLYCAARRGIPVVVINGRISEKSFRGYRWIRGLAPPFSAISRFCVQDDSYRRRLLDLGIDGDRIFVTGNMKYDAVRVAAVPAAAARLRHWLAGESGLVLVCGSTHGDEEEVLLATIARVESGLRRPVRLVLAPRHPERGPAVRDLVLASGRRVHLWSAITGTWPELAPTDVVLVDTIGHLEAFYAAGDVAFVGGSLIPRGGQNMLEPAALGKAVVFGPHTSNFRNDVELLLLADAARQVASAQELEAVLGALFADREQRAQLGRNALALISRNQGATARTLELLGGFLAKRPR